MKKILITSELDNKTLEALEKGFIITLKGRAAGEKNFLSESVMIEQINALEPEILIISADKINRAIIKAADSVKLIVVTRGNPVNVDLNACKEKGITVTCTPARNANCVAELVIALMICSARNLFQSFEAIKDGTAAVDKMTNVVDKGKDVIWSDPQLAVIPYIRFRGFDIQGKTLGLVGLGAIGRKTASKAIALGMDVQVFDPYVSEDEIRRIGAKPSSMDELLSESDFVSLHASVTKETEKMIGMQEFLKMKDTAYLINTARGALVDHDALYRVLKEKRIAGAAVDVFYYEPIALDDPFLKLDNFIITPHIGGASLDVITHHSKMALESILAYANNIEIPYRVI
jgi:D-3-phosphoglycerate dehydrogenase